MVEVRVEFNQSAMIEQEIYHTFAFIQTHFMTSDQNASQQMKSF